MTILAPNFNLGFDFGGRTSGLERLFPFPESVAAIDPQEGGAEDDGDADDSGGRDDVAVDDAGLGSDVIKLFSL